MSAVVAMPPSKSLTGPTLGMASGHTIWLDAGHPRSGSAAGWGWFIDATPGDDSEFTTSGNPLTLPSPLGGEGNGERGRMDLLTVVTHELGHLLGLEHSEHEDNVMYESLASGERHLTTAAVDEALLSLALLNG